jgi:hypothetical protein
VIYPYVIGLDGLEWPSGNDLHILCTGWFDISLRGLYLMYDRYDRMNSIWEPSKYRGGSAEFSAGARDLD